MPFAPPFRRPSNHALATIAIAACAACADFAAPVHRSVRSAPLRPLHIDSIVAPARVVAGDSLRVTLHGACRQGEAIYMTWHSSTDYSVMVPDQLPRPPRAGCAPLVVPIPTHALPPYMTPPPDPVRIRVAVARPRGDSLVHTAMLVFGDPVRAPADAAVDRDRTGGNVPSCPATPASSSCSTPSPQRAGSSPPR